MEAAGAVDAKNAPTAPCKTRRRVSHSYHRPSSRGPTVNKCHPCSRFTLLPMFPVAPSCLPHARNKTLRPCGVHRIFVTKRLAHHSLLSADAKREEDGEHDQVRRTRHPIRNHERLANRIHHERQVHRVADTAINTTRDET